MSQSSPTIFVSASQLSELSVYGHSSHNDQRKINETLPEGSKGYNMRGTCCAVTNSLSVKPQTTNLLEPEEIKLAE